MESCKDCAKSPIGRNAIRCRPCNVSYYFGVDMKVGTKSSGRRNSENIKWRNSIIAKYGNKCYNCGSNSSGLHAHHIMPFSEFPKERTNPKNGITLCSKCHYLLHSSISVFKRELL